MFFCDYPSKKTLWMLEEEYENYVRKMVSISPNFETQLDFLKHSNKERDRDYFLFKNRSF